MIEISDVNIKKTGAMACDELKNLLMLRKREFENALIPDLSYLNYLAENHTGIEIVDLTHTAGNKYSLSYTYEWSIYNGCSGMDESGVERDTVAVRISDCRTVLFIDNVCSERSSADEL